MKGKTSLWIWVVVIVVALFATGVLTYSNGQIGVKSIVSTGTPSQPSGVVTVCGVNPSVVSAITDTLAPGPAVTPTNYYRQGGVYVGTSMTTKGSTDVLITAGSYVSKIHPAFQVDCGSNLLTDNVYAFTNATVTVYSNNGLNVLSNSATAGATNETVAAAGGSYTWKYHAVGVSQKSTGRLFLIVETSPSANVSSITLNAGTPTTVPNGYSRQLSNSYAVAYILPSIDNGAVVDYYVTMQATSGKLLDGLVYTTLYGLQPFVETDGSFNVGNTPFDSLSASKYHDVQTYNWGLGNG